MSKNRKYIIKFIGIDNIIGAIFFLYILIMTICIFLITLHIITLLYMLLSFWGFIYILSKLKTLYFYDKKIIIKHIFKNIKSIRMCNIRKVEFQPSKAGQVKLTVFTNSFMKNNNEILYINKRFYKVFLEYFNERNTPIFDYLYK